VPEKAHILVVCGYGCHLDTPLGKVYLPRVVRFIRKNIPTAVIFCGGFTQKKTAPNVSEAELMYKYVKDTINITISMRTETNSYTTLENLRNAADSIRFYIPGTFGYKKEMIGKITIFCEATRAANVIMLARHFMIDLVESIDDITVETASWERADPFKQVYNMIYNRLAIRFPYLAHREHQKRLLRSELI